MKRIRSTVVALAAATGGTSLASFPINQTVGNNNQPSVLRVFSDNGAGTANLIGSQRFGNKIKLAFVTADHVVSGSRGVRLGFGGRGPDGSFEFNTILYQSTQIGRGDLNVFGVTIELPTLANDVPVERRAAEQARRERILAGLGTLNPVANPNAGAFNFSSTGYGLGAEAARVNGTAYDFVYDPTINAHQYGIKRSFNKRATGITANANVGAYRYDRVDWTVGNQSGAPGDSGAGLWADGRFVGILTGGRDDRFADGRIGWMANYAGRGLSFSEGQVTTMTDWSRGYVPTPGTAALLAAAGVLCARRRRS
jgi:hypothetical protein